MEALDIIGEVNPLERRKVLDKEKLGCREGQQPDAQPLPGGDK